MKSRWYLFLPAVAWMGLVFLLSSQTAPVSDAASHPVAERLVAVASAVSHAPALAPEAPGYADLVDTVDEIFRETMHAVAYAVLGALVGLGVRFGIRRAGAWNRHGWTRAALLAFAFCVLYSLSDETHQLFVPGRSFQLLDLALDWIGSAIGLAAVLASAGRTRPRRPASNGSTHPEGMAAS